MSLYYYCLVLLCKHYLLFYINSLIYLFINYSFCITINLLPLPSLLIPTHIISPMWGLVYISFHQACSTCVPPTDFDFLTTLTWLTPDFNVLFLLLNWKRLRSWNIFKRLVFLLQCLHHVFFISLLSSLKTVQPSHM